MPAFPDNYRSVSSDGPHVAEIVPELAEIGQHKLAVSGAVLVKVDRFRAT